MKTLISLTLLPLFMSVQVMASLCSSQCDIEKNYLLKKNVSSSDEHQGCHQSKESSEPSSTDSDDCASKICQLDEIVKSNGLEADAPSLTKSSQKNFLSLTYPTQRQIHSFFVFSTGPPGNYFYFSVPLYILKSSYLI